MMQAKRSGRPGHPMRRTTSLTEFAPPDVLADVAEEEDEELQLPTHAEDEAAAAEKEKEDPYGWAVGAGSPAWSGRSDWLAAYRARAAPAPLGSLRRNSADFSAAAFLRACELCNRRLGPGRDTFMYRGDMAFCSLECRQQHMTMEEWKEKCTALATTATPPQAYDPVKPASSERTDKPVAATAAAAGGGGGMLAAARVR